MDDLNINLSYMDINDEPSADILKSEKQTRAMDVALKLPEILEQIFKHVHKDEMRYSPQKNVKSIRLVSKLWNDVLLSLPKPRLCLIVVGLPLQDLGALCANLNPKLARHTTYSHCPLALFIPPPLKLFFDEFSPKIEILSAHGSIYIAAFLHQILIDYELPKMKKLIIRAESEDMAGISHILGQTTTIPVKHQLVKFVSMRCSPKVGQVNTENDYRYRTLLENIMKASPNLNESTLLDVICPDLSTCTKLKKLKFNLLSTFEEMTEWGEEAEYVKPTSLDSLTLALDQVKNSLEKLHLIYDYDNPETRESLRESFRLPELMPRLKYFINERPSVFVMGEGLRNVGRMTSLESLELGRDYVHVQDEMNGIIWRKGFAKTVKRLKLKVLYESTHLCDLKIPFPKLERLDVTVNNSNQSESMLASVLEALAKVEGLKYLTLRTTLPERLGDFAESLQIFSQEDAFKALKKIEIVSYCFQEYGDQFFYYEDVMEQRDALFDSLTLFRRFDHVEILKCHFDFSIGVKDFIKENNLPVIVYEGFVHYLHDI